MKMMLRVYFARKNVATLLQARLGYGREYAAEVSEQLRRASEIARQHLRAAADSASRWYNAKSKPQKFAVGDPV